MEGRQARPLEQPEAGASILAGIRRRLAVGGAARAARRGEASGPGAPPASPPPRPLPAFLPGLCAAAFDASALGLASAYAHFVAAEGQGVEGRAATVALAALFTIALGGWRGGYRLAVLSDPWRQARAVLPAAALGWALALLAAAAYGAAGALEPAWAAQAALLGLVLVAVCRAGIAAATCRGSVAGRFAPRAVVLGGGPQAARLADFLRRQPSYAFRFLGVLDDGPSDGGLDGGAPRLGRVEDLSGMLTRDEVDLVILADQGIDQDGAMALLQQAANHRVDVRLAPHPIAWQAPADGCTDLGGARLLHLLDRPLSGWSGVVKTAEDCVLALAALAVTALPMALIALAIKLDSPGPVLFRQKRIGLDNRPFEILKFRTARHHEADRRVTPVGALLRRSSLDELPQIFCVLRGDMSFVGPRPHAPGTRVLEQMAGCYARRHRVKPGLTGLAQVRGWRGPSGTRDEPVRGLESDLEYIEAWSIWLDIRILIETLVAVVRIRTAH